MSSPTPPTPDPDDRPVVSTTSILIFSGFLIGVTLGRGAGGDLSPYVLSCGLAGMLAFVGFELVETRKRERGLLRERKRLLGRLERYLDDSHSNIFEIESAAETREPRESPAPGSVPQLAE